MKSLIKDDDEVVNTFRSIFKFDVTLGDIRRMLSYMIDKQYNA